MFSSLKKSFTLIELLIVIAIIGILSAMVVVALNNARFKAKDSRVLSDLVQIRRLMEMFYGENSQGYLTFAGSGIVDPAIMCCSDSTATFCQPTGGPVGDPPPPPRPCQNMVNLPDETKQKVGKLAQDILNNTNSTYGLRMASSAKGVMAIAPVPSKFDNPGQPTLYTCFDSYSNIKTYGSVLNTYLATDPFWLAWDSCRLDQVGGVCACP